MKNLICWWFGCVPDYEHSTAIEPSHVVPCGRCGAHDTCLEDRVGDNRHGRLMTVTRFWLWRKWVPFKCPDCKRRYGSHDNCDMLPF